MANELKWFGALPQSTITYGDQSFDFSSDAVFDEVVSELRDELATFAPTITRNHVEDGTSLGLVREMQVLTLAQAREKGIKKQKSPRMIYFGVEPTDDDVRKAEYASVNLQQYVKDESTPARTWRYWLADLSITGGPHLRHEQEAATDLANIQFSAFCADSLQMEAQVADIKEEEKTASDEAVIEAAIVEEEASALETANARIAELEAELKAIHDAELKAQAESAVAELEVSPELSAKLSALYVSDRAAYEVGAEAIRFMAAKAPVETPVVEAPVLQLSARAAGEGVSVADEDLTMKAFAYQKAQKSEGNTITFSAAMTAVKS